MRTDELGNPPFRQRHIFFRLNIRSTDLVACHQSLNFLDSTFYSMSEEPLAAADRHKLHKIHNYKQLKEAHVSNLTGGSIWEINEVTLVLPVSPSEYEVS
jgi:hypothetical protein